MTDKNSDNPYYRPVYAITGAQYGQPVIDPRMIESFRLARVALCGTAAVKLMPDNTYMPVDADDQAAQARCLAINDLEGFLAHFGATTRAGRKHDVAVNHYKFPVVSKESFTEFRMNEFGREKKSVVVDSDTVYGTVEAVADFIMSEIFKYKGMITTSFSVL